MGGEPQRWKAQSGKTSVVSRRGNSRRNSWGLNHIMFARFSYINIYRNICVYMIIVFNMCIILCIYV